MGDYFDANVVPMTNLNWINVVKIPEFIYCKAWKLKAKLTLVTSETSVRIRIERVSKEELINEKLMQGKIF